MTNVRFRAAATLLVIGALSLSACSGTATPSAPPSAAALATVPQPSSTTTAGPTTTPSAAPTVGTWIVTGSMITARAEFTATLLPNGKVLVAGGVADNTEAVELASAELYDPGTGTWSATGSMRSPRARHTATLLANGKVLVAGGFCAPLGPGGGATKGCPAVEPNGAMAVAELYDPATGKWTATGSMTTERSLHTATLLADGKVLVAGAEHRDGIYASTELYDPSTGKWTATGSMSTVRTQQFAAKLGDGKVLVFGGCCDVSPTAHGDLASAEVYDPATRKWAATGGLITGRAQGGTAALLGDGTVIVAGGDPGAVADGDPMLASAELYDPGSGTWSATTGMNGPRVESSSTLLANGRVFVVGGFAEPGVVDGLLASAELFDPNTRSWIGAGSMSTTRFDFTATLLVNGQVLVTGGLLPDGVASSAELYDPGPGT
jgi:N-acetylneuraminic acid mutarotase